MKNGMLTKKRARKLHELMRNTKSAPITGAEQSRSRARIIGTGSAQTARIVLAYHDANANLRAEVKSLRSKLEEAELSASMACEQQPCGECPGCAIAEEHYEADALTQEDGER